MSYAPTVNDNSGLILGNAIAGAADTKLQGTQALAGGITSAGGSIANGILQGVGEFKQQQYKQQFNAGQIDFLHQSGILTDEDAAKLVAAPLGKQDAGIQDGMAQWSLINKVKDQNAYLKAQTNAEMNVASYKNELPDHTPPTIVQAEDGIYSVDPRTGKAMPVTAPTGLTLKPKPAAANPLGLLGLGGGAPGVAPAAAPAVTPAPAAAPATGAGGTISAADATRLLGKPVQPGQVLRDANGNTLTVQ